MSQEAQAKRRMETEVLTSVQEKHTEVARSRQAEKPRKLMRGDVERENMVTRVYSTSEGASLLGVSRHKVVAWIHKGKIRGARGGKQRRWEVPQSEIYRIKAEQEAEEQAERAEVDEDMSFDYQVTDWATKEELSCAGHQLEKYHIPYVWRHQNGKWAIFRHFETGE